MEQLSNKRYLAITDLSTLSNNEKGHDIPNNNNDIIP